MPQIIRKKSYESNTGAIDRVLAWEAGYRRALEDVRDALGIWPIAVAELAVESKRRRLAWERAGKTGARVEGARR